LTFTIVGQLAAAQLALGNQLKPGSLQVLRLKAFLRGDGAINEAPENTARHADHALVLADADAEFDGPEVRVSPRILSKAEKHGSARSMSGYPTTVSPKRSICPHRADVSGAALSTRGLDPVNARPADRSK
jgi:hypothetical protein